MPIYRHRSSKRRNTISRCRAKEVVWNGKRTTRRRDGIKFLRYILLFCMEIDRSSVCSWAESQPLGVQLLDRNPTSLFREDYLTKDPTGSTNMQSLSLIRLAYMHLDPVFSSLVSSMVCLLGILGHKVSFDTKRVIGRLFLFVQNVWYTLKSVTFLSLIICTSCH